MTRASVTSTNGTSLRMLSLHKWLQVRKLRQSAPDWRKLLQQLALGQIGSLKLVPFVTSTDAPGRDLLGSMRSCTFVTLGS